MTLQLLQDLIDGLKRQHPDWDAREIVAALDEKEAWKTLTAHFQQNPGCHRGHEVLNVLARANALANEAENDLPQCLDLWGNGWTSHVPPTYQAHKRECPLMSLYWRRPARTKARPGKLFLSTNQAHRSLERDRIK